MQMPALVFFSRRVAVVTHPTTNDRSGAERMICSLLYSLTPRTLIAALRHPEWGEGGELFGVIKVKRENQSYQPINNEGYRVRQLTNGR